MDDMTTKLLEAMAEAILKGGIIINNVKLFDGGGGWRKISFYFYYKFNLPMCRCTVPIIIGGVSFTPATKYLVWEYASEYTKGKLWHN